MEVPNATSFSTFGRNISEMVVTFTHTHNHSCLSEGPRCHIVSTRFFVTLVTLPERLVVSSVFQVVELGRGAMRLSVTTHDNVAVSACDPVYPDVDTL